MHAPSLQRQAIIQSINQELAEKLPSKDMAERLLSCGKVCTLYEDRTVPAQFCRMEHLCSRCVNHISLARLRHFIARTADYSRAINRQKLTLHRFILRPNRVDPFASQMVKVRQAMEQFEQFAKKFQAHHRKSSTKAVQSGYLSNRMLTASKEGVVSRTIGPAILKLHLFGSKPPFQIDPHYHLTFTTDMRVTVKQVSSLVQSLGVGHNVVRCNTKLDLPLINRRRDSFEIDDLLQEGSIKEAVSAHLVYVIRSIKKDETSTQVLRRWQLLELAGFPQANLLKEIGCRCKPVRYGRPARALTAPTAHWDGQYYVPEMPGHVPGLTSLGETNEQSQTSLYV